MKYFLLVSVFFFAACGSSPIRQPTLEELGNGKQIPYADNASDCQAHGGKWGWLDPHGSKSICRIPTTDGGKPCLDSSECDGFCVAKHSVINKKTGRIISGSKNIGQCEFLYNGIGCGLYIKAGQVAATWCTTG